MDDRATARVVAAWAAVEPQARHAFRTIWQTPELGMMEYRAEALLSAWLADHGFRVERGLCGLPTAFRATWSSSRSPGRSPARSKCGPGPVLGFMAEYDALPGQGNLLQPARAPDGGKAGHACGHNLIAGAAVGAAIAARHAMEELGLEGTLICLGTPAEELLWGKIALLRAGAFQGIDALFANHADYQNGAVSRPCLACISSEFVFSGASAHGGARRSHNALDAAELFVQSMERLRAHQFHDAVIGHVLRQAGVMPSIVPAEARLWLTVRHESFERAEQIYNQLLPIAHDAARYTGTTAREMLISASRGYLANHTLGRALLRNMEAIGPPAWDQGDIAWLQDLAAASRPNASRPDKAPPDNDSGAGFAMERGLALHSEGCDPFGQDDGEASWRIPLARVNWAVPSSVPFHSWAMTAAAGHESQFKGGCFAGQAMALTAIDLLADPAPIAAAGAELRQRVGGRRLSPPRCGGFHTMTQAPASFWDASWQGGERLAS